MNEKHIKRAKSIISVIFVGALGSGMWDLFLKDLLFYLANAVFIGINSINDNFIDSVYSRVGSDNSILVFMPGAIIIIGIIALLFSLFGKANNIMSYFFPSTKAKHRKFQDISFAFMGKRKINIFIIVHLPLAILVLLYSYMMISISSSFNASSKITRNMEIIRPYISDAEFYSLRSKYRQVNNKQRLEELFDSIFIVAYKHNLELSEVELLGIKEYHNANK